MIASFESLALSRAKRKRLTKISWPKLIFLIGGFTTSVSLYFYLQLTSTSLALKLAFWINIVLLVTQVIYFLNNKAKIIAINGFQIIVIITTIEAAFFFELVAHTSIPTWTISSHRQINSIDFFDTSPFLKFKPNRQISSLGSRGDDFTYTWQTDKLGFKNIEINETSFFHYLALGDSFTEGMGVRVHETWTHLVSTDSKFQIYNAAIQGYSASQMLNLYLMIDELVNHHGVIIGLLPTTYSRELDLKIKDGVGGIKLIHDNNERIKRERNIPFLASFIRVTYTLLKQTSHSLRVIPNNSNNHYHDGTSNYLNEIPNMYNTPSTLKRSEAWKIYVANLIELIKQIQARNKKVIVIQYPHRHEVIFSKEQLGIKNFGELNYYVELSALETELRDHSIDFHIIDLLKPLRQTFQKNEIALYFEQDGHMNQSGHKEVAKIINDFLENLDTYEK